MSVRCVGVIVNPNAGKGISSQKYRQLIEYLEKYRVSFMHAYLADTSDVNVILDNFFRENFDIVMVLGGDGTLNHVGQYLVERDIPVIVIPFGSGNDFYHTHWGDRRMDLKSIVLKIVKGEYRTRKVDVALVEGEGFRRYFFNSFGMGIAGSVARSVNRARLKRGFSTFFLSALKDIMLNSRPFYADLKYSDDYFSGGILSLHAGINPREGGGFLTFPLADPGDGLLDLVYLSADGVGRLSLLLKLQKVKSGKHLKDRKIRYLQVPDFSIKLNETVVAHMDGEDFDMDTGEYKIRNLKEKFTVALI